MGWITQQYEDEVHIVPDNDEEIWHVLEPFCQCSPVHDKELPIFTHRDKLDRIYVKDEVSS